MHCCKHSIDGLFPHVPITMALKIAQCHKIPLGSHVPKKDIPKHFAEHVCVNCSSYCSIFRYKKSKAMRKTPKTTSHIASTYAATTSIDSITSGHGKGRSNTKSQPEKVSHEASFPPHLCQQSLLIKLSVTFVLTLLLGNLKSQAVLSVAG